MKLKNITFLLTAFCFFAMQSSAQELMMPLKYNQQIKGYLKKNPASMMRLAFATDTLILPFVDDFSKPGIYPNNEIWIDSGAFINSTFCDNPITVGVATLDGIDKFGNPYDISTGYTKVCDSLTSKPIDLAYAAADSVYLTFFFQPQGFGDAPEKGDSLVLAFKRNGDTTFTRVWSDSGMTNTAFQRVDIKITDPVYLYAGFQFCFYNYATPNGNRDHWNIDYVWVDKYRTLGDLNRDNGFKNNQTSILKDYTSVPWQHYKSLSNPAPLYKTSFTDSIYDFGYAPGGTTITYTANIFDATGGNIFTNTPSPQNAFPGTVDSFLTSLSSFTYPSNSSDSTGFVVKNYFSQTGGTSYAYNDTNYYQQIFHNYYAYDDGSAELQYGIPDPGAKMAYKFHVQMENSLTQDTLRGLQIYFNPSGPDVHNNLFQLAYWSSIDVAGNTENLIYNRINQKPYNIDSINGFATYLFDTVLVVHANSDIYVGLIQDQTTSDTLGVGLDINTNVTGKKFAYYSGMWHESVLPGAWMMRPLFGKHLTLVGVDESEISSSQFDVYPNPCSASSVEIVLSANADENYSYQLNDIAGQTLMNGKLISRTLDVSSLADGIYFLQITGEKSFTSSMKKIIIAR